MATQGPAFPERRPAPASLTLNLSSNNPFRNRNLTPSPRSADPRMSKFPMNHNNPFLDASETAAAPTAPAPTTQAPGGSIGVARSANVAVPDDIFNDLSLLDKNVRRPAPPPGAPPGVPRPNPADDPRARPRGPLPPRGPNDSPVKREPPRRPMQRRASESSIMEKDRRPRDLLSGERDRSERDRPPRTESEERRRRERRKEREERHRKEKEKGRSTGRSRRPQGLDIIDKLDVTGVYGQGLFHHDGPFDACNPHRNSKKDRRAPMQAFPADSANMALGGFGPAQNKLDLDRFHGRGEEGFNDYATAARRQMQPTVIDPTARTQPVHGEETYGLGTSTFLEGAPASRSALQRRDSEEQDALHGNGGASGGGLGRKKSLAQRFRGMSGSRPYRSPEARYTVYNKDSIDGAVGGKDGTTVATTSTSPPPAGANGKSLSAGGAARARYDKAHEVNPFDNDYEAAFAAKGTQIRLAAAESPARPTTSSGAAPSSGMSFGQGHSRAMSNPRGGGAPLVRSVTNENGRGSSSEGERLQPPGGGSSGGGGGFLSRMKSMKKSRAREQKSEA